MPENHTFAYDASRALALLRLAVNNPAATFRDGQEEAIRHLVENRGRLLVVQKTGWGKSFVYFIAAKLLREAGLGPALLVSPLLALMRNQIEAASRMGVRADRITSDNRADWVAAQRRFLGGETDIMLISPERLDNDEFKQRVLAPISPRISMLVVDEAHCISDWGHDFRPQYRLIERLIRTLPRNMRLLATTATANNRVVDDLKSVLGANLSITRGDLSRPSLFLQTIAMPSQAARMAWLDARLRELAGSGIIYVLTIRDAVQLAEWLQSRGHDVAAYTGSTDPERRPALESALLENRVKALVATSALGMGFDKPDLAFVIHYQAPGSVVAYYQQVGRAGRAVASAYGVLLGSAEEDRIHDYFIRNAFPSREEVAHVINALAGAPGGLSLREMQAGVNTSAGRIEKAVQLLALENPAPIAKEGARWKLTASDLPESFWRRADRLTALRRAEHAQMKTYLALKSGHMEFLITALDGDVSRVRTPPLAPLPESCDPAGAEAARAFLRRTSLKIEPRVQWPSGGLPKFGVEQGSIPENLRAGTGRILCVWGDAGWGGLVRRGKYADGRFGDELVEASAALARAWFATLAPAPAPTWVACIPSLRHPRLVPDFASRLASALGLAFHDVLQKTDARPEQKTMSNSVFQARNIDGSLAFAGKLPRRGPVLLVDDIVDSRWTFTVAAWLMRTHGCNSVYPFALADSSHDK